MSDRSPNEEPLRVDGPPPATPEAQDKAHDPALVSPEPSAEVLAAGALS